MEYSPFINEEGNAISLEKLEFADVCKIDEKGIEEGYKVEFKSQWDDNFKNKHLCQTIASFANAEGGWLLVGIEDNTGNYIGIQKQRADFSQIISQKLASVTPRPKFDCRFLHEPNNESKGVLVIQIYAGINPPYVCNGTVYTRNGSSKVPIKSDRSSIDELLNRKEKYNTQLKEFCVNKFVNEKVTLPYCTVYLFNSYNNIDYEQYNENAEQIKTFLKETGSKGRIMSSIDSVIKLGSDLISANSITSAEEYYLDGNIKLYIPLFVISNSDDIDELIDTIYAYNKNVNLKNMIIVDGMIAYLTFCEKLKTALDFIKSSGYKISDYNIVFEYKNIQNVVFYHKQKIETPEQEQEYIQNIKDNKFYFSRISEIITKPVMFKGDVNENELGPIFDLINIYFFRLFGIEADDFLEMWDKCKDLYNDSVFSSDTYHI